MTRQAFTQAAFVLFVVVIIFISGAGFGALVARTLPMVDSVQVEVECAIARGG